MASKISKMMDRTGKTSIFDHGKVRLAKRRKCGLSGTRPRSSPSRDRRPRGDERAARLVAWISPRTWTDLPHTSNVSSQAYYVAQTAPSEFKVRRDP